LSELGIFQIIGYPIVFTKTITTKITKDTKIQPQKLRDHTENLRILPLQTNQIWRYRKFTQSSALSTFYSPSRM